MLAATVGCRVRSNPPEFKLTHSANAFGQRFRPTLSSGTGPRIGCAASQPVADLLHGDTIPRTGLSTEASRRPFLLSVAVLKARLYRERIGRDTEDADVCNPQGGHLMFRERERKLQIGGQSKTDLLSSLGAHGIQFNKYAHMLFDDPGFTTSESSRWVVVTDVTVAELGLAAGSISADIFARARSFGLELCPLELAPHFRIQFLNQPEGPYLTVASAKTRDDEAYPNGFYLRRLDGTLWLRGYRATADYPWEPTSRFVFLSH